MSIYHKEKFQSKSKLKEIVFQNYIGSLLARKHALSSTKENSGIILFLSDRNFDIHFEFVKFKLSNEKHKYLF